MTVTDAAPLAPPAEAVTVKGPPGAAPAVSRPAGVMAPPPVTAQAKAGWGLRGAPPWLLATAVNCWVPPATTEAAAGVTVMAGASTVCVSVAEALGALPASPE